MPRENMLEMAKNQFTGFLQCRSDNKITSLVSSMGLTSKEWDAIKKDTFNFTDDDIAEIDAMMGG